MEDVIRQLTHDNQKFDSQWEKIETQLTEECDKNNMLSIIDALAEYVVQEPQTFYPSECKFKFLTLVLDSLDFESKKANDNSLFDHVFQVFIRVFDQGRIDLWHLAFLKELYQHLELGKYLSQKPSLVEQLFASLQKHSFILSPEDEFILNAWERFWLNDIFDDSLLNQEILLTMKDQFQQLCRFAIQNSSSSPFWCGITSHIIKKLPRLFESYANPTDAQLDLDLYCTVENSTYRELIRKSFSNQINLFQTNYTQILLTIEHLLLKNNIYEAQHFLNDVLLKHILAIPDLEPLLQMFIRITSKILTEQREEFVTRILLNLSCQLGNVKANKQLWPLFFDLAIVILEIHTVEAPSCAVQLLRKENFYPWKEFGERSVKIIHLCGNYDDIILNDTSYFNKLDSLDTILSIIYDRAKVNNNLFHDIHSQALIFTLRWISPPPDENKQQWPIHVYKMGIRMMDLIDSRQITLDIYSLFLQRLHARVQLENENGEIDERDIWFYVHLAKCLGIYTEILKTLSPEIHNILNSIFLAILDRPMQNENGTSSFGYLILRELWLKCLETLITEDDARIYEQSVSRLYTVAINEADEVLGLFGWWSMFWHTVGIRYPQVAVDQVETFLNEFFDRNQMTFLHLLQNIYPLQPEPFHARIDNIIQVSFQASNNTQNRVTYLIFLGNISKQHPEIFSSTHIDHIFTSLSTIKPKFNDGELHCLFQFFAPIAVAQPNLFHKHHQDMMRIAAESQNVSAFNCLRQHFISSTIVNGDKVADDHLDKLICLLQFKDGCTQDNRNFVMNACQEIGIRHRSALEARRMDFVALNCSQLVDFIDKSKMTEENKQVLEQSRQEIETIDKRVQNTETDVHHVKSTLQQQEITMTSMHAHVDTIDTRLQDVTERVDIHQKEIERIDAKTLSYVPAWAGNICKLLNRRASNDWRLLGRRFGYSSSELRHWATQYDPCMALLNEWYMTHKADEATFGLIRMLKEIGRQDIEEIIQKAVKDAGETIPDNMPDIEIHRLPPVFISYQWNSQAMVSQLKGRLEEAGYSCWMDLGQMGGGQDLYSKVDKGIRGAKVILCCMNQEYAKLDTCVGQVNLAISTGKPFIPLQMEKQTWPPEGALGPLMSEYLFIRFFDRKATNDPNFWPDDRFAELLGQIRYYVAPDPEMISERYKNWFVPRVENLIFLNQPDEKNEQTNKQPMKTQDATKSSLVDIPLIVSHPQIMVSYQWDRQSDIIDLYKRLTKLGYRLWLDIFQMGGGDSLFAKIDAGIRNAQCVIACITPKYTLSTNCRREMSLADALGKPIIPLLMEQLNETWPPAGPMSPIFTGRIPIDICSHQKNDMWHGKGYDQILIKLKQFVPEVQTENPNRHLIDMERPSSSTRFNQAATLSTPLSSVKRIGSAPVIPQSRACSIM